YETEFTNSGITYWELSNNPTEPLLTTDGNHITYSEVTEKLSDGSFTVYTFSNHDVQQYRDEDANATYVADDTRRWRYDPFTSRELERGNLLSKTMYAADNSKVREEIYTYNDDPNRFNTSVRFIDVKEKVFIIGSSMLNYQVY